MPSEKASGDSGDVDLRPEERSRLGDWLDQQGFPAVGERLEVRELSGGASNVVWQIGRGGHRWVLRKPPRKVVRGRNDLMLREYRLLRALRDTDVPHPRALAVCEGPGVLGSAFYVMEHVDGWSCMDLPSWPPPFDSDLEARAGLAYQLIEGIARLARVDWRAIGLEGFGRPENFHERQVDRWLAHLEPVRFRDLPGLDEAAAFLRRFLPRSYEPGIIHGDYQFANVMFAHGAPARLVAIVDWEMATVGDPLLDLAWVLMTWPDPDEDRKSAGYVDYSGMPSREQLTEYYAQRTGRDLRAFDYYLVLARFKMAAVLEAEFARFRTGQAENPKLAYFGDLALDMARKAGELARTSKLVAGSG